MSVWSRISDALEALVQGESLTKVFEHLRTPPERSVAFTIAVIALGAKMAKADGLVTRDEVAAFREVFHIRPSDEAGAARVFNLARQDVAGFEDYAERIHRLFGADHASYCDLVEGLFHIAMADGEFHANENIFLARVAEIFEMQPAKYQAIKTRFVPDAEPDPYTVLGVAPDAPMTEIKAAWRQLVRTTHPDAMVARGVPEEAIKIAEKKMIDVNRAWETINGKAA